MAAILTCGPNAALSHWTAAAAWGIAEPFGAIHVARTTGTHRRGRGIRLHRPKQLPAAEVTNIDHMPLTTVSRTLVDLAGVTTMRRLADLLSASRRLRIFDAEDCRAVLRRAPNRRGSGRLEALVSKFDPVVTPSLSELQDRVLLMCIDAGIPRPEVEAKIGNRVVDFLWRDANVILEVDGIANHHHRFDEDRNRDLDHLASDYRTARVTFQMIEDDPHGVIDKIRKVLGHRSKSTLPSSPTDN